MSLPALLVIAALAASCDRATIGKASPPDASLPETVCKPPPPASDLGAAASWSLGFGDPASQTGEHVAVDGDGNVYLAGAFAGAITLGGHTVTAVGAADHFVVMLDATGALLWMKGFDGTFDVRDMKLTRRGNVVLGGTLDSPTAHGLALVTLDACGVEVRRTVLATAPGTTAELSSFDVADDRSVVVAGGFHGTIDLGAGPLTGGGAGLYDSFIAKLDDEGLVWTRPLGLHVSSVLVALDTVGGLYVTARLSGTLELDGSELEGQGRILAMRLDGSAKPRWSVLGTLGEAAGAYPSSVAVDAEGNLLLGGSFAYGHNPGGLPGEFTLDFGAGVAADYVCCGDDAFLASIDQSGKPRWIHGFGGLSGAALVAMKGARAVAVTAIGAFDVDALGPARDPIAGSRLQGGAPRVFGVDLDPAGWILLTGDFYDRLWVGPGPGLMSGPGFDRNGFVAKLAP